MYILQAVFNNRLRCKPDQPTLCGMLYDRDGTPVCYTGGLVNRTIKCTNCPLISIGTYTIVKDIWILKL